MQSVRAHVRAIGNGAVVEATFRDVSATPSIVAVATAQNHKFNVTPNIAQRAVTLERHRAAWVQHAKAVGGNDVGQGVMWLINAQPGAETVTVREIMAAVACVAQLADMQVGILMDQASRDSFVQHWDQADDASVDWARLHIFTSITGLHAYVAVRGDSIRHVCHVSGVADKVVQDMYVQDNTVLHAVVHGGSFVYQVPHEWPMAMVQDDMPMLAAENGNASVQSRGGANAGTTIEIRRVTGSTGPVRLLYVSKFCDNNGPSHPVQWLRNFVLDNGAAECMQQDGLLLSLVLRAASAHTAALRSRCGTGRRRMHPTLQSVASPHLHRSVTQQRDLQ